MDELEATRVSGRAGKRLPGACRKASRTFELDSEAIERCVADRSTEARLAMAREARGIEPLRPVVGDPNFDLRVAARSRALRLGRRRPPRGCTPRRATRCHASAMLGARIKTLVEESHKIEELASKIQGETELLASDEDIRALEAAYMAWFARGLGVLPEEFRETFRSAYEGNWHSNKIKAFLQAPGDPNPLYDPENPLLAEFWSKPFATAFRPPLMDQRQVLLEAREKVEGTGETSQHIALLERMCRNFHAFARPLKNRGRDRAPFAIEDEYDVQTLLDGALRLVFDDVRLEDFVPEYAGGKSRVDFLLKAERIVIETKMTRNSMSDGDLGEQLLLDIARYKAHPDCGALVVLVYDPEQYLANPRGLERDLSKKHNGLSVFVYVTP